jgi:hypothetical protein
MFENGVLRRIFGPGRDEVTGGWRKLHNEELRDLYSSPNVIRKMKSRRMRWARHVARMRRRRMRIGYWWDARRRAHIAADLLRRRLLSVYPVCQLRNACSSS